MLCADAGSTAIAVNAIANAQMPAVYDLIIFAPKRMQICQSSVFLRRSDSIRERRSRSLAANCDEIPSVPS